jgi:hypothetical protein
LLLACFGLVDYLKALLLDGAKWSFMSGFTPIHPFVHLPTHQIQLGSQTTILQLQIFDTGFKPTLLNFLILFLMIF